jgi:hypothetical protein
MRESDADRYGSIIAFRCSSQLREEIEQTAAAEGLSNADVARRACLLDLAWRKANQPSDENDSRAASAVAARGQ